jgi:RHS repeat-associated protein
MKKTNNQNTEYTTRSSIMRFRNLFAGIILFSMLALLTPSALCAVTKMVEEYPKLYDSQTGISYDAAILIKDNDEVVVDFKGTIWAPNGFRGITKKYTYSTSQEDWALDSEEEFTITTPGVHKTPMGATVVVPGFIGMNNPFYLGVEMGTRTVGIDLRATIPNVKVGEDAQLCLTLIKDGVQYHRRFDIDLGAGENTALFDFDGAFYEDEDGEGEDAEYAEWGSTINQNVSNVSGESDAAADDCVNESPQPDPDPPTGGDETDPPTCGGPRGPWGPGGPGGPGGGPSWPRGDNDPRQPRDQPGGGGCGGTTTMMTSCQPSGENPNGGSGSSGDPHVLTSGISYDSNEHYGPYSISTGVSHSSNRSQSAQPRVGGSAGTAGENWALDAYQMVQRKQVTIGSETIESWSWFKGDRIVDSAGKLEDDHYCFDRGEYAAEFVDDTTLNISLEGDRKMVFNNLSSNWMRLAYANLPNGDTVEYHYDGSDRLQYMTYPDNTTTEFQYVSSKIDKIIERNGNYLEFNLGTTIETIEMYDNSDTLLSKSGWEYDSDSKQIKKKYRYSGNNLSTQSVVATYTFTTVGEASVVATASSEGILTTYDTWDSQPAGSSRAIVYNGVDYVTNEILINYIENGSIFNHKVLATNDEVVYEVTASLNRFGWPTQVESQLGTKYITYQYDVDSNAPAALLGNIISVTNEIGIVKQYEYEGTEFNSVTSSIPLEVVYYDKNGNFLRKQCSVYDATGNLLKIGLKDINDEWITFKEYEYSWDPNHEEYRTTQLSDALGRTKKVGYNSTGQITQVVVGSATSTYVLDSNELMRERISAEGRVQKQDYYDNGRLYALGIDNATTYFGYSHMQCGPSLTDVTDAKGQWTKYVYDDYGRYSGTVIYGDDSTADLSNEVEYDAWGRRSSTTDYMGQEKKYYYNTSGSLIRTEYVNGSAIVTASVVYNHDDSEKLTSIQSYCDGSCSDTMYYGYDELERPLYRSGVGYGNISWSFDDSWRIDSLQWMKTQSKQTVNHYAYDGGSRVAAIYADSETLPLVNYSYTADNKQDIVLYENNAYTEHTYDSIYGHLTSVKNKNSSGTVIAGFDYTYDLDGLVTNVTQEDNSYIAYSYDNHNRLTDEHKKNSSNNTVYRHQYQYDAVGNRTQHIHTDSISNSTTFTLTYNDLNQLTKREWTYDYVDYDEIYTYDLNGNLTQKQERQEDAEMVVMIQWDYTWDHEDRLIEVVKQTGEGYELSNDKKVQYRYCPSCGGNRTHKIVYDWNSEGMGQGEGEEEEEEGGWELVKWLRYETIGLTQLRVDEKYDSDQDGLDEADPYRTERVTYNGTGSIKPIIKEILYTYSTAYTASNPTKTDFYCHYDRLGVVQALTNSNGTLITDQRFESDAFGFWDGEDTYTTRRITGKEYDEDVELYFFQMRWYNNEAAIFISKTEVPVYAEHPYSFVNQSPCNYIDPSGMLFFAPTDFTNKEDCLAAAKLGHKLGEFACMPLSVINIAAVIACNRFKKVPWLYAACIGAIGWAATVNYNLCIRENNNTYKRRMRACHRGFKSCIVERKDYDDCGNYLGFTREVILFKNLDDYKKNGWEFVGYGDSVI